MQAFIKRNSIRITWAVVILGSVSVYALAVAAALAISAWAA